MSHFVYTCQTHEDGRVRAEVRVKGDWTLKVYGLGDWQPTEKEASRDAARMIGKLLEKRDRKLLLEAR